MEVWSSPDGIRKRIEIKYPAMVYVGKESSWSSVASVPVLIPLSFPDGNHFVSENGLLSLIGVRFRFQGRLTVVKERQPPGKIRTRDLEVGIGLGNSVFTDGGSPLFYEDRELTEGILPI